MSISCFSFLEEGGGNQNKSEGTGPPSIAVQVRVCLHGVERVGEGVERDGESRKDESRGNTTNYINCDSRARCSAAVGVSKWVQFRLDSTEVALV